MRTSCSILNRAFPIAGRNSRILAGDIAPPLDLVAIGSDPVHIPDPLRFTHLQFRRFAGCPVCNLHLHAVVQRHNEILAASIREVVVFHSTAEALLPHAGELPFAVIADPEKKLYRAFGVESAASSLLHPRAWVPILRGILHSCGEILRGRHPVPTLKPQGGRFGLPADFLIAKDGRVLASRYGVHAFDQWSVDELLALTAAEEQQN